jgi:hypothetical protein
MPKHRRLRKAYGVMDCSGRAERRRSFWNNGSASHHRADDTERKSGVAPRLPCTLRAVSIPTGLCPPAQGCLPSEVLLTKEGELPWEKFTLDPSTSKRLRRFGSMLSVSVAVPSQAASIFSHRASWRRYSSMEAHFLQLGNPLEHSLNRRDENSDTQLCFRRNTTCSPSAPVDALSVGLARYALRFWVERNHQSEVEEAG